MKIAAIEPRYGCKRTAAAQIVAQFGDHHSYFEPYCGSMAVLLSKQPCPLEVVGDLDNDLINLSWVIRNPVLGPQLYRRLRRVLVSDFDLNVSKQVLLTTPIPQDDLSVERAYHYFIVCWLGRNGESGTKDYIERTSFSIRWSAGGGDATTRYFNAVKSMPHWRRRLKDVHVLLKDALEMIRSIHDRKGVVIYIDPPYLLKTREYKHDFFLTDHGKLALALQRFREARVIVSYYDHPALTELYPSWKRIPLDVKKHSVNTVKGAKSGGKAPEVLLINGEVL